ncbi:hypothetical protein D3C72_1749320 [compost metagenome]
MLKKKALKAERVRKAPATPISAEPAMMAPLRTAITGMPCPSAACGFSPTMRTARPSGVRISTQASNGTSSSASKVSAVCSPSIGIGSQSMASKGVMVGGVFTFGKLTR